MAKTDSLDGVSEDRGIRRIAGEIYMREDAEYFCVGCEVNRACTVPRLQHCMCEVNWPSAHGIWVQRFTC